MKSQIFPMAARPPANRPRRNRWHPLPTAILALAVMCLLHFFATPMATAAERINTFHSRVSIEPNGDLLVTETLEVRAEGQQIKRGIYRDFPTKYRGPKGKTVRVGFDLLEVRRDGSPEPYHLESKGNGIRIYVGKENRYLQPGDYTYEITYRTTRQIGFFEDYDELYWNVTGNDWAFPIGKASCRVELPAGAPEVQVAAYTGPQGGRGQDFSLARDELGNPLFTTTRPLQPREGLTVAVAWEKGYVTPPGPSQRLGFLLSDYGALGISLLIMAGVFGYYLLVWRRVGRDPAKGTIVPLYTPPKGISPAAARYIMEMGFDKTALAAALVNMAVKGYQRIEQDQDDTYTLERTAEPASPGLSPGEKAVAQVLFGHRTSLALKQSNHSTLGRAVKALKSGLQREYEKSHFLHNRTYFIPGVIISLIALAILVLTGNDLAGGLFMSVWLGGWTVGCTVLALTVYHSWKSGQWPRAMGMTLFALPFFGGELFGLWAFGNLVSPLAPLTLLGLALINFGFYQWLKAPTLAGRKVMDELEGFKLYMQVAEKERLNLLNPPERTPALFERYLPYALALGVEQAWSEQFADVLAQAQTSTATASPHWYRGSTPYSHLGRSLGSAFTGAVSSASTAPGSSSGSGGGGSSGGGGGGGGGGGW
ncbi:MAG: DUF2207 domain-containing protein [Desulfobacterales bacterium]